MSELKPCRLCGKRAIIESWSSGGMMYMAKCSNPDCFEYYPRGHSLPKVIEEWNQIQDVEKGELNEQIQVLAESEDQGHC